MSDLFAEMEADFEASLSNSVEKLDQGDLTTVAGMAKAIRDKEEQVKQLEEKLKAEKKSLLKMTDEDFQFVIVLLPSGQLLFQE